MRVLRVGHGACVRQILLGLLARLLLSRAIDALLMRELQRGQLLLETLALGGLCVRENRRVGERVCERVRVNTRGERNKILAYMKTMICMQILE